MLDVSGVRVRAAPRGGRAVVPGVALAVAAALSLALAGPAAPAAALSCAAYEFDAMGFATGTAPGAVPTAPTTTPEEWRGMYAGVVLGTVVDVEGPPGGPLVTHVEVTGSFGPPVPGRVEVEAPWDEWNVALEPGVHYLIPYSEPGFASFPCDPVFEVAETDVPALVAASESGLWPRPVDAPAHHLGVLLPEPAPDPSPEPGAAAAPGQLPRSGWPPLVASMIGALVVLGLLGLRAGWRRADRRRRAAAAPGQAAVAGSAPGP